MRQTIYILYKDNTKTLADIIADDIFVNRKISAESLTQEVLSGLANTCNTEYFYVIDTDIHICFSDFNFDYKPEEWDAEYVHVWGDDARVRLYNTHAVLSSPDKFTDDALRKGLVKLKNIDKKIYSTSAKADIIFLSYDEVYADQHYKELVSRFPKAKRMHGVKGIYEAHKAAAKIAISEFFYIVDADARIVDDFDFSFYPAGYDMDTVHVWYSKNPVNGLEYGYGGVKLFPTKMLRDYTGSPIDFTTSLSKSFKVIPTVSNITCFNTDPFSSWRSAFRECAKLASKIIPNQDNTESEERLRIWCSAGEHKEFGDFAIMGANEGLEFGEAYKNQPELLRLINDYCWLAERFST